MNERERDILIQRLFDGELPEEDFAELQDQLIADPEARKRLYDYAKLHQGLCFLVPSQGQQHGKLGSLLRIAQHRLIVRQTLAVAAAAIILTVVILQLIQVPQAKPLASLRTAPGTTFAVTHTATSKGKEPVPGTLEIGSSLELESGTAELELSSGIRAIVRAPARLVIQRADRVFLDRGKAWFQVAKEGRGFQVVSRELEVTDLGTEFGVIASDNDSDEVHCFKGEVVARALGPRAEERTLTRNQAFSGDFVGRVEPVRLRPEEFLQSLPSGPTFLHWSFDDIEAGGFRAQGGHPAASHPTSRFAPTDPGAKPGTVSGRFGQALHFDGNDDLSTEWPGILGDAPRSVAIWIKVPSDQKSDADILGWGMRLPHAERFNLKFKLGLSGIAGIVPVVSFGGTRYYAIDAKIADGRWHHLVCTYRGGPISGTDPPVSIYFDGKPCVLRFQDHTGSPDQQGRYQVNTSKHTPLAIGSALSDTGDSPVADQFRFRGAMDELYIFEYPISEEDVGRLFRENIAP